MSCRNPTLQCNVSSKKLQKYRNTPHSTDFAIVRLFFAAKTRTIAGSKPAIVRMVTFSDFFSIVTKITRRVGDIGVASLTGVIGVVFH